MTAGKNADSCGLKGYHAYSLISAFIMKDKNGTAYNMFILRDPWGYSDYN